MKIEKLPSGSYRIRQQYKGKRYTIVVDHKPTQKEALQLMADQMDSAPVRVERRSMTFEQAYEDYLELKSNILSPSTKRGYRSVIGQIPASFKAMKILDIDTVDIQKVVNDYSSTHSPKSVRNLYGLISIILKTYCKGKVYDITLPQKEKKEPYIPTDQEVKAIMQDVKDTRYYIPLALAALGLRKSEICALTLDDLSVDNRLTINKALVKGPDGSWSVKTTKTTDSTRDIYIPPDLADLIRTQGYIYKGFPDSICRQLVRSQEKLGIQHFPLHKMRHFFVSYAHNELHLSDEQIMKAGGWKSTSVMSNVYRHSMNDDEVQMKLAENLSSLF